MTWTGADGSVWDILHGDVYLRSGVRGLGMPAFEDFTSTSAGGPGQSHRGWRAGARDVFWPVTVNKRGAGVGWLELDRAWWASLSPDMPGTWTVTQEDGARRHLN